VPHTLTHTAGTERFTWLIALLVFGLLSGCASATKAKKIEPVEKNAPAAALAAPPANLIQRLDVKLNIQFDWWKLLKSPQLNLLIEQSFANYPTVASAQEVLLKAQQSEVVRAGYFHAPVGVSQATNGKSKLLFPLAMAETTESRFIGNAYYDLHAHRYTVGYLPELFRSPESSPLESSVEVEQRRLQLEATYRTLAANLIACAVQEASLRAQMGMVRKIVAIDQSLLSILRKRQKAGLVAQEVVLAQQASVARSEQVLLFVKQRFEQTRELLHLLLGVPADSALPDTIELMSLQLTEILPFELPVTLIEQRPDLRVAQVFGSNDDKTSAVALKNLEEVLSAAYRDGIELKAAQAVAQENMAEMEKYRHQFIANKTDYQDVLLVEQSVQLAALRSVQSQTQNLGDAVALYHALGGVWWNEAVALEAAGELIPRY